LAVVMHRIWVDGMICVLAEPLVSVHGGSGAAD
jgi:hypothetical protein